MNDAGIADKLLAVPMVRPTLFIGLGGTGHQVLLGLRYRIMSESWNGHRPADISSFPAARFILFDTDFNGVHRETHAGSPLDEAVRLRPSEIQATRADIRTYLSNLDAHPEVKDWVSDDVIEILKTSRSAGMFRQVGRLCFFDQRREFMAGVESALRELSHYGSPTTTQGASHQHGRQRPRVVVIASTAGGTGSGAFIDVGLAIQAMMPRVHSCDLYLALPGSLEPGNTARSRANTYAALSELEHMMRPGHRPPYAPLSGPGAAPNAAPGTRPFDDVYLIDTRNEAGRTTTSSGVLFDMVAGSLFDSLRGDAFGNGKERIAANQMQYKVLPYFPPLPPHIGRDAMMFSRAFSAIGQASITTSGHIDHEADIADAAIGMMEALLRKPPAGSTASADRGIVKVLDSAQREASQIRNMARRARHGVMHVIDTGPTPDAPFSLGDLEAWATEAMAAGPPLSGPLDRVACSELMLRFRQFAADRLADRRKRLTSASAALMQLPAEQQHQLLKDTFEMASPWICLEPRPDILNDQRDCIIGVSEPRHFQATLGAAIQQAARLGRDSVEPRIVEHQDEGRIVVECHLSGFPLDAIADLRGIYRKAYDKENANYTPISLYNHKDSLRFPQPDAPSIPEMQRTHEDLKLFVRGVACGLLQRHADKRGSGTTYALVTGPDGRPDHISVGSERTVLRIGFYPRSRKLLEDQLAAFEKTLAPIQFLALSLLFEWTAQRVYTPHLMPDHRGMDWRRPGLAATAATTLEREYMARHRTEAGASQLVREEDVRIWIDALSARILSWTSSIPDSCRDADQAEPRWGGAKDTGPERADKRRIDPERFAPDNLKALASAAPEPPARSAPSLPPSSTIH